MSLDVTVKRMTSAAVMLAAFFLCVLVAPLRYLFPVMALGFGCVCLYEIGRLIAPRIARFPYWICFVFLPLLLLDGYFRGLRDGLYILAAFLVVALSARVVLQDCKNIAAEVGAAFLATAYIGLPMAMAVALLQMTDAGGQPIGHFHLIFQICVLFGGDSAAYFVGRNWGKRPFFRKLSPKKTLEGAAASVVFSVLIALLLTALLGALRSNYGLGHGLVLGLLLGVAAPLGDLAESMFKRDVGQKDSSKILQGHGGFLDVFDSLLFGLPVQFCYIQLVLANS